MFINETPLFDYVYGELSKELHDFEEFDSESKQSSLIENPKYSDAEQLAARLISGFEELPRRYQFTFKLNSELSAHFHGHEYKLTDSVRLIRPNAEFTELFPLVSGIPGRDRWLHGGGLLGLVGPKELTGDSLYLQVESHGFVGKWTSTTPEESAVSVLKSVLGTCLAVRAFRQRYVYSPTTIKQRAYIHEWRDNRWRLYDSIELDESVSNIISELVLDDLDGTIDNDQKKRAFLTNRLKLLERAWSDEAINERILLAGKWLLDSYSGKNELLSFVQATVALEILLGEKTVSDLIGLGELLRNRCAYLVGKTHAQRNEILDDFKKIYEIRSKIVHRGKDRLKRHEKDLLYTLRWLVSRVIQEELERIERNA
ncbi:HEPN domain-containing protein [Aliidiomarina sanyensis]|nr:HEPN domain-containing protein [Aliidiomarina sanyensis]